jgi:RNA polymerase sigma-70 factor (ECF subfamily)
MSEQADSQPKAESDSELVARLRGGDVSAFEAVVGRHRAAIVAFAATRLGSPADAEDIAQEAFVRAYFRLAELRDPDALLPWLRRIAERLVLMRLRARREEATEPERLSELAAENGAGEMDGLGLPAALAELPLEMRRTVSLTYLAGYTCAEAAEMLGVKEGTVKSRLSRARARLKEVFAVAGQGTTRDADGERFTRATVERLMREARKLLEEGEIDEASRRAAKVVSMQAKRFEQSPSDPNYGFVDEAAHIWSLPRRERRRREAEANAAQYGFTLEELDWEVADVDMMEGTLGKPEGRGKDIWGVPHTRLRMSMGDARDVCRRLNCSPQTLSKWVDEGCPILRCWPFARFDFDRVNQWLRDNQIEDWPKESDYDLDRPVRVIFRALHRRELDPEEAESIITNLGWGNWG